MSPCRIGPCIDRALAATGAPHSRSCCRTLTLRTMVRSLSSKNSTRTCSLARCIYWPPETEGIAGRNTDLRDVAGGARATQNSAARYESDERQREEMKVQVRPFQRRRRRSATPSTAAHGTYFMTLASLKGTSMAENYQTKAVAEQLMDEGWITSAEASVRKGTSCASEDMGE